MLMLNPEYVPQHLLILACVLRYIMAASQGTILQKPELDALVVQAFAMEITNPNYLQDLQLTKVNARGVQLATLVMEGVETALLVNDACGSPVPWPVCCPWLFFDGKLFHTKLARTQTVRDLAELCEHRADLIVKVEKLRKAILDGLVLAPHLPPRPLAHHHHGHHPFENAWGTRADMMQGVHLQHGVKPRGGQHRGGPRGGSVGSRGGQLEVAGVVVSSWMQNYGGPRGRGHHHAGTPTHRGGGMLPSPRQPNVPTGHHGYNNHSAPVSTRGGRGGGIAGRGGRGRGGSHVGTGFQNRKASNKSKNTKTTVAAAATTDKVSATANGSTILEEVEEGGSDCPTPPKVNGNDEAESPDAKGPENKYVYLSLLDLFLISLINY